MSSQPANFESPFRAESNASPFSFAGEDMATQSPFSMPAPAQSPFSAVPDEMLAHSPFPESGKPAKLPPPRNQSERMSRIFPDSTTPFGYDALTTALPQQIPTPHASPFGIAPQQVSSHAHTPVAHFGATPFTIHPDHHAPAPATALHSASPFSMVSPPAAEPQRMEQVPQSFNQATTAYSQALAPQRDIAPVAPSQKPATMQIELRAIFGLDRDLSADEILQRCRALPGIRNVARISSDDICAFDFLKHNLSKFGFDPAHLRLCIGQTPLEFITAENTTFAVVTDGSFAPGVRETLILAARQLSRMS
jgi:hypothetical protein